MSLKKKCFSVFKYNGSPQSLTCVIAREAIYKKIHKTAYGEEWQYSFTDFVSWDKSVIPSTPHAKSYSPSIKSSIRHSKPIFKIEESISRDGTKRITIIQN